MQVVRTGDCLVTWSTSVHNIGSGSQVYDSFMKDFPASHGDIVGDEHSFSSLNERLVKEDHPDARGNATGMCPRSQG